MQYDDWDRDIIPDSTSIYKPVRYPRVADLRDERGNRCEECQSPDNLEFAHVKETRLRFKGRGQTQRYYDIKKNPDSYKLLCKKCHRKLDRR
jgi:hypothetical protein